MLTAKYKEQKIIGSILLYVILILITVLFCYPIFLVLLSSFKTPLEIFDSPFSLPQQFKFDNYVRAWEKINFHIPLFNSLLMTLSAVGGLIVFGSMAAYVCARNKSKSVKLMFLIFVSCIIVPFQTALIPLVKFISSIHLIDTRIGVILVYIAINMSFTIFLYTGFIQNIPLELEEAAIVDGCRRFAIFRRIIFPLIAPVTVTVAILNALNIWNDFLIPLLLISSPIKRNIPSALLAFQGQYNNKWDLAFASLILSIIPIVVFYLILQKHIIKGVTQGAIKS